MDEQKRKTPRKIRHVKWDEDKLKQTQKTRGTFPKIKEPKTPYHVNSDEELEDIEQGKSKEELEVDQSLKQAHKNKVTNKHPKIDLAAVNAQLKIQIAKYKQQNGEFMEQEEENAEDKKRKEEFKKKRAAHYNQFKMIQQARKNKWESDDDDQ